ncbi:MAG: type II secretion system protein [Tepidisphaerales bacterium]
MLQNLAGHAWRPRGFTLVEILTVLAIVVVLVTIGWGVIFKILDPASRESARNQISAALTAARAKAIAANKTAGVLFFIDPRTKRVGVATVIDSFTDQSLAYTVDVYAWIGLHRPEVVMDLASTEFRLLPAGVTIQCVDNCLMVNGVPQDDQFIGFNRLPLWDGNTLVITSAPIGGIILFNGHGELVCRRWALRYNYPKDSFGNQKLSPLAQLILYERPSDDSQFQNGNLAMADAMVQYLPNMDIPRSNMGIAILDREAFEKAIPRVYAQKGLKVPAAYTPTTVVVTPPDQLAHASSDGLMDGIYEDAQFNPNAASMPAGEIAKEAWIARNAHIFMVSRFSGTLIDARAGQ